MGALDGPGLRCVVFMQGCPLRCACCHNPETWEPAGGTEIESSELMAKVLRLQPYFGRKGGLTLSGGEPMDQPEFVCEILRACRQAGIHTALDTSGCCTPRSAEAVLDLVDLVILDIKHSDADAFHKLTGGRLETTKQFLASAAKKNVPLWVRQVIIPGINDTVEQVHALAALLQDMPNLQRVELLAYHDMGQAKWKSLGMDYPLKTTPPASAEQVKTLQALIDGELFR